MSARPGPADLALMLSVSAVVLIVGSLSIRFSGVAEHTDRLGDEQSRAAAAVSRLPSTVPAVTPGGEAFTQEPADPVEGSARMGGDNQRAGRNVTATVVPTPRLTISVDSDTGLSRVVEYGTSGRWEVALTFDCGNDRGHAEEILDLLAAEGIKASFGITGVWAEENPDLVKRMVDEGHMLFNHTWDHPSFTGASYHKVALTREERGRQLEETEALVMELTGYDMRPYFRPPFGDYDDAVLADLAAAGYDVTLLWSRDSRDSLGATADEIVVNSVSDAAPGRIVLLHVGGETATNQALPRIIESLRDQGFAFVTVDQLLRM